MHAPAFVREGENGFTVSLNQPRNAHRRGLHPPGMSQVLCISKFLELLRIDLGRTVATFGPFVHVDVLTRVFDSGAQFSDDAVAQHIASGN